MSEVLIEFHAEEPGRHPAPYAAEGLPLAWIESLMEQGNADEALVGMLAAARTGFVLPLSYDCEFRTDERGNISFASRGAPITTQEPFQYHGTWFERLPIIKFRNPWVIRTPAGYCSLIVPMINRFEIPFEPLSGVVETDCFYQEVFFPTICTMRPSQHVVLPRGTPLVQVIPIPREPWVSVVRRLEGAGR